MIHLLVFEDLQKDAYVFQLKDGGDTIFERVMPNEELADFILDGWNQMELLKSIFSHTIEKYPQVKVMLESWIESNDIGAIKPLNLIHMNQDEVKNVSIGPIMNPPKVLTEDEKHEMLKKIKADTGKPVYLPAKPNHGPWFMELYEKKYLTLLEQQMLAKEKNMQLEKGGQLVMPIAPNIDWHMKKKKEIEKKKWENAKYEVVKDSGLEFKYFPPGTGGVHHESKPVPIDHAAKSAYYKYKLNQKYKQQQKAKYSGGGPDPALKVLPALAAKVLMPKEIRDTLPENERELTHPLRSAIITLNDRYKWTREQVADWLETLDVDITFKVDT